MKTFTHRFIVLAQVMLVLMLLVMSGCGRTDTRVNSDPGPGRPSRADGGDKAVRPDPNHATPPAGTTSTTGRDSTGRPSDASGGTTASHGDLGTNSGTSAGQQQTAPRQ